MIEFVLGLLVGYFVARFQKNIAGLWRRTETKIEKALDEK